MFELNGARVLVVGGTSGIGLGTAQLAAALGGKVAVASRSADKVRAAQELIGHGALGHVLDTRDESAIEKFFGGEAPFDHVVVSASETTSRAVKELPLDVAYANMNSKFWGAYRIARAARISGNGSLTLVSGYLSIRPRKGSAISGRDQCRGRRFVARPRARACARPRQLRLARLGEHAALGPVRRAQGGDAGRGQENHPGRDRRRERAHRPPDHCLHDQPVHDRLDHLSRWRRLDRLSSRHIGRDHSPLAGGSEFASPCEENSGRGGTLDNPS